jgi:Peptidase family C25/Propeptide_C25
VEAKGVIQNKAQRVYEKNCKELGDVIMKGKLIDFIGIIGLIFFLLVIFPANLFAGEYSFIYKFKQPVVRDIGNGSQIVELEDTRQNDAVIGAPLLPVKGTKIFIPAEEKVTSISVNHEALKSIEGTYTIQHATTPYPTSYQGPVKLDEPDPDIYSTDADYPSVIHIERGSQYLCGVQIVVVDLSPVVYNPVQGQLNYYGQIEVTIQTQWQGRPAGVMPSRNLPADRKQILRNIDNKNDFLLLNPAPASQEQSSLNEEKSSAGEEIIWPAAERDYVVITTSAMISAFTDLTNHRQSAAGGSFTTHIEDIDNILSTYSGVDDAEKMRNFIIDTYTNYGTKYVVLGGDCDGAHGTQTISTRGCYALTSGGSPPDDDPDHYIPSDLYFGCLDGTWNNDGDGLWGESNDGVSGGDIDWYSEVYVGRIPADNATEATNQINKIIAYETGSPPNKTLLVGEQMNSDPTWAGDRIDWVYGFMNSMPKTELYDRDHTSNDWPKSDLLTHINSNTHNWLNHLGHGNPIWNMKLANADVASMANSRYFFLYTQACYSGSIDGRGWGPDATYISGDCVLEDMVNSNNHGAFAIIGSSRYGWYSSFSLTSYSNLAHKEFVEAIFTDGYKRLGEANQRSKTDLNLSTGVYRWIAFETNLLGCPATEVGIGGTGDELALDFGAAGLWDYDGASWTFISGSSPEDMAGWSHGLALDFGASGLWNYDGTTWTPLSGSDVEDMTDWANGLATDFGASGVWNYDGSTWTSITGSNPEDMAGWSHGLAMDFGASGLWSYDGSTWTPISGSSPESMVGWSGGLAMDFGASGLWSYNGTTWAFITGSNVEDMANWANGLSIDFGASGVWNYDGSTWDFISGSNPEGMLGWSSGLAMDFAASGVWNYDGTAWSFISGSDVEYMDDVDLY